MADDTTPKPRSAQELLDTYFATFGAQADFDRWTFGPQDTLPLMWQALQRGTPVTEADLDVLALKYWKRKYAELHPPGALR